MPAIEPRPSGSQCREDDDVVDVAAGLRTASGDHHHGDSETAIYVVSGHPVFVFAEDGEEVRLEASPGDYVFVPPFTPHREENPHDEEAVVLIARSSQEAIVVNLPGLLPGTGGSRVEGQD